MSIGEGIKQLLEERKRVILPGFGNLKVKESGGSVPAPGKRIDPPGPIIKFDNSFSKDDGVLATVFAKAEGIEKIEAEQQVLELVDAIRFALDKGESYPLAGAGMFRRDEEGKIHFQVDPTWVLEPDQYGLDSMDLLELEDLPQNDEEPIVGDPEADKVPTPTPIPTPIPVSDAAADSASANDTAAAPDSQAKAEATPEVVAEKASEKIDEPESIPAETSPVKPVTRLSAKPDSKTTAKSHEPWKDKKTKKRSKLWRTIWIVTGSLLVVLVVLIVVPAEKWERAGKKDYPGEAVQVKQPIETPVAADQPVAGEDNAGETVDSEAAEEAASTTEPEVEPLPVQSDDFFIIAGSFSHLANASELQDVLKAKGYPAEVMVTENRMYRVSVASYATNREAEASLLRIQSEPGMEACWLLCNE